jgi:single-strand DNA-binding protein
MASDINSVNIVGRLTRDIEIKYSQSGTAIGRFSVANTQSKKQGEQWIEESHFFDCTLLGRRADALQKYLLKGQQVAVHGKLQQDRWQDKQTGQNRSKVGIFVSDIQLLGGKRDGQQGSGQNYGGGGNYQDQAAPAGRMGDEFDDDIPF